MKNMKGGRVLANKVLIKRKAPKEKELLHASGPSEILFPGNPGTFQVNTSDQLKIPKPMVSTPLGLCCLND